MTEVLILDAPKELLGHVAVAMRRHRQWAATQGVRLPSGWSGLEEIVRSRATEGQPGTPVDDLWEFSESRVVPPQLLTYEEVAEAMNCSTRQVKRLTSSADLPAVKVGGLVRVRVSDLESYIESLTTIKESA